MRFQLNGLPLVVVVLACAGCVTADRSDTAQSTREPISRYQCTLEYEFAGGTMRASVNLNEDGSVFARSGIKWERAENGSFTTSLADPAYEVLPPRYSLVWPVTVDGQSDPALGQIYLNRHVFPADPDQPGPSGLRLGLRSALTQPGFGSARFGTDPQAGMGSLNLSASLDEVLALARGGGVLYGVITDEKNALVDYWAIDSARFERVRGELSAALARMQAVTRDYRENCRFIEDVEANRIYVTWSARSRDRD